MKFPWDNGKSQLVCFQRPSAKVQNCLNVKASNIGQYFKRKIIMILEWSGSLIHRFDLDNPWPMILAVIHNYTVCSIIKNFRVRLLFQQWYNAFHQHEWPRICVVINSVSCAPFLWNGQLLLLFSTPRRHAITVLQNYSFVVCSFTALSVRRTL